MVESLTSDFEAKISLLQLTSRHQVVSVRRGPETTERPLSETVKQPHTYMQIHGKRDREDLMKTNVQEFVTFVSLFLSCQQWRAWHTHKRCFLSLLSPFTQPFQPAVDGSLQMFLIFKSHGDSQSLFFCVSEGLF